MDDELNKMFPQRPGGRGGMGGDNNGMSLEDEKIAKLTQNIRKDEKREFKAIVTDIGLGLETMPQNPDEVVVKESPVTIAGVTINAGVSGAGADGEAIVTPPATLEARPIPNPTPAPDTRPTPKPVIPSLRTYERDIADAVRAGETEVSINLAAQRRREERHEMAPVGTEKIARNTLYIIMSAVLIVVATITLGVTFYLSKEDAPADITVTRKILSVDSGREVLLNTVSRTELSSAIQNILGENKGAVGSGTFTEIYLEKPNGAGTARITAEEFFKTIAPRALSTLARAFISSSSDQSGWLLGFHDLKSKEPFVIFSLNTFDSAYEGMLKWEKNMLEDIGPIFVQSERLFGTTTKEQFEDLVVRNRDARVLKNTREEIVLLYSFIDQNHLVITTNEGTFREIITRFLATGLMR